MTEEATRLAVACRGIVKDFGDGVGSLRVLHGVDLDVHAGQLSLLVGPSGCGKTTLISIIGGLLTSTRGGVEVFGTPLNALTRDALSRFRLAHIGFVFQQYNLLPTLTAAENAAVPSVARGVKRKDAVRRAHALLEQLEMSMHTEKLPSQLSGGQQQRVAIARALINEPQLVICDEPTAALDARSGARVMALLKKIAVGRDRACIVVTHDHRVHPYADRVIAMEDGRIDQATNDASREPQ